MSRTVFTGFLFLAALFACHSPDTKNSAPETEAPGAEASLPEKAEPGPGSGKKPPGIHAENADLSDVAADFNSTCPRMLDVHTRLDSASYVKDSSFRFYYTLVGQDLRNIDAMGLTRYLRPRIIGNIRGNPEMAPQRAQRADLEFLYRDRRGEFVAGILITAEEYHGH